MNDPRRLHDRIFDALTTAPGGNAELTTEASAALERDLRALSGAGDPSAVPILIELIGLFDRKGFEQPKNALLGIYLRVSGEAFSPRASPNHRLEPTVVDRKRLSALLGDDQNARWSLGDTPPERSELPKESARTLIQKHPPRIVRG